MSQAGNGSLQLPKTRGLLRPNLRAATLILPTGERVKRKVTLREPLPFDAPDDDADDGSESPLLAHGRKRKQTVGRARRIMKQSTNWLKEAWGFANSKTGRGVVKCSLAYLLGSMATFVPFLSRALGHNDGKHMVATITVYFHPGRSQGSMLEAILYAFIAFLYAMFISFTSMGVSIVFGRQLDLLIIGHIIVLVVFCGGGLGFVGWVKQRLGNPLVNVACSLTSLAIITVLTKEGSVQAAEFSEAKVVQVLKMILMGVVASTTICFVVAPVSARAELRQNMIDVTDSFADMLAMITRGFLMGSEKELENRDFHKAEARYKKLFTLLTKNLREAKFEHFAFGTERSYALEVRLVDCLRRMSQNIGGLRSAADTQFTLLAQPPGGGTTPAASVFTPTTAGLELERMESWMASQDNYRALHAISETPEDDADGAVEPSERSSLDGRSIAPTVRSPVEVFERFIMHLGPSMKSLAYTMKQILDELPYGPAPAFKIAINPQFRASLTAAIDLYSQARQEALRVLYKDKDLNARRPRSMEADFEEVSASCGHFSFSLQDFAEEMKVYLDILEELKAEVHPSHRARSWTWLKFWTNDSAARRSAEQDAEQDDPERRALVASEEQRPPTATLPAFAGSVHMAAKSPAQRTFNYRLWKMLRFFWRDDIRFAIKVGVGAALYAVPSFLIETHEFYSHWRGEWGLLSYMLVCSMTIGASNTTGFQRFWGTCLGAVLAIIAWTISDGNVFAMAASGWFISLFTAYLIVAKNHGPLGRFIILTYNLSALYAYSLSVKDEDHDEDEGGTNPIIGEIALHRVVAVLSGVLWGLIITRVIWPISARKKFKDGLSLLWLRMGWIWRRDPLAAVLEGKAPNAYMNIEEEFEFQHYLAQLELLRSSAVSEFELRGKFPSAEYGRILKSTARILDATHALNTVIMKDLKATKGEAEILEFTIRERAQLCSRISHLFQVLASSLKLEFAMNDALPNTDHARDRLLAKVFTYRRDQSRVKTASDEDYGLLYAYALVTGQLSLEIREIGREIEALFGVVDEDLFQLQ